MRIVGFVLEELRGLLVQSGLYLTVRFAQYGIPSSHFLFFVMLERYNLDSCPFFSPSGKMGFELHKMYEVSDLPMGDLPYENTSKTQKNFI